MWVNVCRSWEVAVAKPFRSFVLHNLVARSHSLTDEVNSRELFMKGINHGYFYEGYATYQTRDLS